MSEARRFGEIRSLLHDHAPSAELWEQLTHLLWGWREKLQQEPLVAYCNGLLERWPDALRLMPRAWNKALLAGRDEPIYQIIRALNLSHKHLRDADIIRLSQAPHLAQLAQLDLSDNDLSRITPTGQSDWLDALARAAFIPNLTALALRMSPLSRDALPTLQTMDLRRLAVLELSENVNLGFLPDWFAGELAPRALRTLVLQRGLFPHDLASRYDGFLDSLELDALLALPKLDQLESLDVRHCDFAPRPLWRSPLFERLRTFRASISLHSESWRSCLQEHGATNLEHLHIEGMPALPLHELFNAVSDMTRFPNLSVFTYAGPPLILEADRAAGATLRERRPELEVVHLHTR